MDPIQFIEIFRQAMKQVDPIYYTATPSEDRLREIYGDLYHDVGPILRNFFSHYGERAFCYELYHQVRHVMDCQRACGNLTTVPNLVFHAELGKGPFDAFWLKLQQALPDLPTLGRDGQEAPISALSSEFVPDFLLHEAFTFRHQEVVIEVKAHPELPFEELKADLLKIKEFLERYRYKKGVFVSINAPEIAVVNRLDRMDGWEYSEWTGEQPILILIKQDARAKLVQYGMCPPRPR